MDIDQLEGSPARLSTDILSSDSNIRYDYFKGYRRSSPINPEVALYLAVLENGIEDYCKSLGDKSRAGQALFKEVEEWFFGGDEAWYCSFENVCAALSIDPGYVRRGLRHYLQTHSGAASKSAESQHQQDAA
jgi:hypothetical protein